MSHVVINPVKHYGRSLVRRRPVHAKGALITLDKSTGEVSLQHTGEDPLIVRAKIMKLKDDLMALPGEHVEMPVTHEFAKGMYLRKLFVKKGTLLVGKIHKQECMNIVAKGDISVLTETGSMRVKEGYTIVSPAGIQKVGFAHEDTIFINVFLTNETDIATLEAELVCESYDELKNIIGYSPEIEGVKLCQ